MLAGQTWTLMMAYKTNEYPRKLKHKKQIQRKSGKTHITIILALLIFCLSKISVSKENQESQINTTFKGLQSQQSTKLQYQQLVALHTAITIQRSKHLMKQPEKMQTILLLILILLSNDVNINPGPKSTTIQECSICNKPAGNENTLQCNTCNLLYHISCSGTEKQELEMVHQNSSFQWICPSATCSPNLKQGNNQTSNLISPNKYNILANVKTRENINQARKIPKNKIRKEIKENSNPSYTKLFQELPKISSKDYIGKDLCRSCAKEVKCHQQAIFCDICERWIHRSCSDMNSKIYKQCKLKKNFIWSCNKCRRDEEIIKDKADISSLSEDERPESWDKIGKTRKEILVLHMNCRSAVNKEEELSNIIKELDPDIVTLTETWFDESVPLRMCVPEGYKIIRKDRSDCFKQKYGRNKGGGIAVIYKEHIKVERNKYATDPVEEILWCQVKTKESFMLGVVYRADYTDIIENSENEDKLEENIRKVAELSTKIIVTGDFNIDMSDETHKNTELIKETYGTYGLKQHVTKPTRIDKNTGKPTIIDHIWASEETNLIKSTGTFVALSDHLGQYMKLNQQKPNNQKTKVKFRSYKKYDPIAFNADLQTNLNTSQIEEQLQRNEVDLATDTLIKVIQDTAQLHAPLVEKTIRNEKKFIPWFTQELGDMIKSKNELLQDFYAHGLQSYKNRIKILSNKITQLKRNLKQEYLTEKLGEAQNDGKKCWKILNAVTNRAKVKDAVEPDGMNQEKADEYNKFFATIGIEIQKKLGLTFNRTPANATNENNIPKFEFSAESQSSIEKLIDNIRIDVATGEDNIGAKLIKDMKPTITPVLTRIINTGYKCNTFPNCMKKAAIKVIHKKESTDEISNYRPISILPTLSKIFERAAVNQMVTYLETNNILSSCQHAYRKFHSTVTCLFEVVNHIHQMIDNNRLTAVASLDLSKAFDSISHQLMLEKLHKLGIGKNSTLWISSYLTNRTQLTKFKQYTSKEERILSGVPQGSILGPLLFLCFTNDLFENFPQEHKILAYADDCQLIVNARNIEQLKSKIENVITIAQSWYKNNSMKNNIGKTEVLVFNSNQRIKIQIMEDAKAVNIESKSSIKILGVIIDSNLNWSKQVNAVKKKAFNVTRNIHRINHLLPVEQRIKLYKAVISPQFSYADIIWGGCRQKESRSLQSTQNFAAKSITGHRKYDSATNSLKQLNFLNLEQRRKVHENGFTHKALLQQSTVNINQIYSQHTSTANTRHAEQHKLNFPKHKTSKYQRSPLYRTITSWNNNPTFSFENIRQQKAQLQNHLITTA